MLSLSDLPHLNAALNSIATILLTAGYILIRKRHISQHKLCMLLALAASALFLTSYVVYHVNVGSKPFIGNGSIRIFYFTILISHVALAVLVLPLALVTLSNALRDRFSQHVAIARWTLPIWLYVSVTGVIVYLMLYQI